MNVWPLRFREINNKGIIVSNDAGSYFLTDQTFIERYANDLLSHRDRLFLKQGGHIFEEVDDADYLAFSWLWSARHCQKSEINYLILIPTLRCNLECDYCQVSRASLTAKGYDWSEQTLLSVLQYLDRLQAPSLKIEFQGGEPLLRLDILNRIASFCRGRFQKCEFVVCTNLQNSLDTETMDFLRSPDVYVSTSLDGSPEVHSRQRTKDSELTSQFYSNLRAVSSEFGSAKLSALATIDPTNPPDFEDLTTAYEAIGQSSIFFRPINYQGFARRSAKNANGVQKWNELYRSYIEFLVRRNFRLKRGTGEYYLTYCLNRVLQAGHNNYVDLRNPNFPASGYALVDFDGKLYPSDEARMLARIGYVDLSIGDVESGFDEDRISQIGAFSTSDFDPDCVHCPYQPYCGVDYVDDISRYGRIDLPRHSTWFCGRQTDMFDLVFELLYSEDVMVKYSLAQWLDLPNLSKRIAPRHHDTFES